MEGNDGEGGEWEMATTNDVEQDTATVIEMAAFMLGDDGAAAFDRALSVPLAAIPSTLAMATSMIATLAEQLAEFEDCSPEQVLLELRCWTEPEGEENE